MSNEVTPEFRGNIVVTGQADLELAAGLTGPRPGGASGVTAGQSDLAGLKPDSGPWRVAVTRPNLVARSEAGRVVIHERMAELGIPPNRPLWREVLVTPGFMEVGIEPEDKPEQAK